MDFYKKKYQHTIWYIDILSGWAVSFFRNNSEQLVGESNPCFRRERAAS